MLALEMQETGSKYVNNTHFDTDYGTPIGVDKRFSGCIYNTMDDFVGPLVGCNVAIKIFVGTRTEVVNIGTIMWEW